MIHATSPAAASTTEDRQAAVPELPTLHDVFLARQVLASLLAPTPLMRPPALVERLGCDVYVKCESLQPIGAFKVRGGLYLVSQLTPDERAKGLVTASTGNHGQSIAYAAKAFGAPATIFVPKVSNPLKVAAIRRLGAKVVFEGADFDESRTAAERHAQEIGARFVHSGDEPHLIAGVATYTLEILDQVPDLDVLIVPAGGGSGLSGACLAGKGINPNLTVIGVQAEGAPVVREAWLRRTMVELERADTFAEGLATRVSFALPACILWDRVDDIRLVSDAEIRRAMLTMIETTRLLVEGAGAAALAAAYQMRTGLSGKKVAIIASGGNVTLDSLSQAMTTEHPW